MLTETVLLYFFSASFQGLAAILGLLGVFGIFRLQQLGSSADAVRGILYADRGRSIWPAEVAQFDAMSYADKLKHIAAKDPKTYGTLIPMLNAWAGSEGAMVALRDTMWKPVAALAAITLMNLCALPFSVGIAKLGPIINWPIILGDVAASVAAVWWNLYEAKRILDGSSR